MTAPSLALVAVTENGATVTLRVSDDRPVRVVVPRAIFNVHVTDDSLYCAVWARVAVRVVEPTATIVTSPVEALMVAKDRSEDEYENAPLLSFVALTVNVASP